MRCSCGKDHPVSEKRCLSCGKPLAGVAWRRIAVDATAGVTLLVALAAVYAVDGGRSAPGQDGENVAVVEEVEGQDPAGGGPKDAADADTALAGRGAGGRGSLRLAVTPHEYDDVAKLLDGLGEGYRHTKIKFDDLLYADRLLQYDVIFLTCGGVPSPWLGRKVGGSARGSSGTFRVRPLIADQIRSNLRAFVGNGGTLYISDWQLHLLETAFPEFIDRSLWAEGEVQTVKAEVVDAGLARRLGKELDLRFDQPGWYAAAVRAAEATVYLQGSYTIKDGQRKQGPLLIKVPFQNGSVIFTSFHNEAQNSDVELELLRYLVFATVTAREEAKVKRTMVRGGFSPQERSLLSVSSGGQPVGQEFECKEQADLQFVLGFEDQGARLRLSVTGPDGTRHEQAGAKTFEIDIPAAAAGTWRYTIAPLEVPYQNFPFTLTIGEKRSEKK